MELLVIIKVALTIAIAMAIIVFVAIPERGTKIKSEQVICIITISFIAMMIVYNIFKGVV